MNEIIPIFPLNIVLFPDSIYPLHIFEVRYKKMIDRCINNDEYFGIVSKIDYDIAKIGCSVRVTRVIKTYDNGSMDIIVKGYKRFLVESTNLHKDGYLEAVVTPFNDNEYPDFSDDIFQRAINRLRNIIKKTSIQLSNSFWENLRSAKEKSYKLAEKSGLNLRQQQEILSLASERDRLDYLDDHLKKLENTLDKANTIREIIMNDGYLNQ
ncbi:MAG: LON peptidase substrate-binding domain-containing protein [Melioribacteraceae bacterium]|nr:LON peptidase substrate-binding domain-containing protein [Melioribacteraceae bacterium]